MEIKQINKMSKVTKYRELEEECKQYMNESLRQNRLLKKFLFKAGLARSPALFDQEAEGEDSQLGFLKNQNFKLKEEIQVLKQRYDIQANQTKQLMQ